MVPIERAVLVTGTSTGSIGSALAASFAQQKFLVFATARNPSKIPTSLSSLPNVEALAVDVTSPTSIEAAVEAVKAKNGGLLDYLVNNAGVGYTVPLVDMEVETGKRVFDVGVLSVTKAFMPLLVKAKGTVINISSVGAVVHTPWIGKSCSKNHALLGRLGKGMCKAFTCC